jgi:hypothetical protein
MAPISLAMTQQELFVGSFTELSIDIDPGSGLARRGREAEPVPIPTVTRSCSLRPRANRGR